MKALKSLWKFITTKINSFVTKNTSVEDQYASAADRLINEITRLRTVFVKSEREERRMRELASEKQKQAEAKDKEIRYLSQQGLPVTTHAKLAILFRRTAEALIKKADDLVGMRTEIAGAVVEMDNQRMDLAVKLEYIRETKAANALGITCADDVVELSALTKIDIDETLMRIETFQGDKQTEVTSAEVQNYIDSLK
ncbi:hypothetical protein ZPAH1_orf00046 [Aeromonas phage ZPAH1]|nr:hypothetical protein ASwh1_415 [Aeromonas phage Aswh_1]QQG33808.1 hypothetical protein ZPAH1_orf00046 [Aeromonas phage ZPAH1]